MRLLFFLTFISSLSVFAKPVRSVRINFENNTNFNFVIVDCPNLAHGMWTRPVPTQIFPQNKVFWSSESRGIATGTEGQVKFFIYGKDCNELVEGELFLQWNNPYFGSNTFIAKTPNTFWIEQIGSGKGNRTETTWRIHQNGSTPSYRIPLQLPDDEITSLELRLKTADKKNAGTDNAVWFSIGPYSWNLDNEGDDFERGETDIYNLFCPPNLGIRASDIQYYHLEKKGLGGFQGTSDFPDGEWNLESIELIYNNVSLGESPVDRWLASPESPTWVGLIQECKCIPFSEKFVHSLRLEPNSMVPDGRLLGLKFLPGERSLAGIVTPLFKKGGISGWIDLGSCNPENAEDMEITVKGRVYRKPVISGDGFGTIDIELFETTVCGRKYYLWDFERFSRKRHIRIEYRIPVEIVTGISVSFSENGKFEEIKVQYPLESNILDPLYDELQKRGILPKEGCVIEATGGLKWDTDNEGWYEVHPSGIIILDC